MTLKECIAESTDILSSCSDSPALDARLFISECFGLSETELITKDRMIITDEMLAELDECLVRRQQHVPVAYILGHRDFYGDTYYTPEGVLIPRPDTEVLVENAVECALKLPVSGALNILDVCAGTGCAGISVAKCLSQNGRRVNLSLSDISAAAYDSFSVNAENLLWGLDVDTTRLCGNLYDTVEGCFFDVILSNPPYIRSDVIPTLEPDVLCEPSLALDGGSDGLDILRRVVGQAPDHLKSGGVLIVEIGYDQGDEVMALFRNSGFDNITVYKDLGGRNRVVKGLFQ